MDLDSEKSTEIVENNIPKQDIKVSYKKSYKITIILITLLILLIELCGIYLYQLNKEEILALQKVKRNSNPEKQLPTKKLFPTPTIYIPPQYHYQPVLMKEVDGEWQTINTFPDYIEPLIVLWNNYLFFNTMNDSEMVKVEQLNLDTGIKETIFQKDSHSTISDLQIINDTLFFSLGGYMLPGGTYALDLPPNGLPQKIAEIPNAKIKQHHNRYWIEGGEGDACWSKTNYSTLNPETKKVTFIADSLSGCNEGEEYIDIDSRERILLAAHTPDYRMDEYQTNESKYMYVIAVPLSNPELKEGVISKQDMPEGITSILYLKDKDKLALLGKSFSIFDFQDNSITKIIDIPESWRSSTITTSMGNSICLKKFNSDGNFEIAEVNLETKQILITSSVCESLITPTPTHMQSSYDQQFIEKVQNIHQSLNLPPNYKLEVLQSSQ